MYFSTSMGSIRRIFGDAQLRSQILKFGFIGISSNVAGYGLYLLMTEVVGLGPKSTVSILYPIGAFLGFVGNRNWTFKHDGRISGSLMRYSLAHVLGFALNILLLEIFSDRFHFPHQLVQAAAIITVALFLFVTFRFFVFPEQSLPTEKTL